MTTRLLNNRVLEVLAVVFNLLFTLLYLNGTPWCYLFGVLGPLFLLLLCFRSKLYAEPLLQVFYISFAIYGYFNRSAEWQVFHEDWTYHLPYVLSGVVISFLGGFVLSKYTKAKLPYLDSVVTVFAMMGTWHMVNYLHENWVYFIGVNTLSVWIYLRRRLFLGAAMFLLYLFMAIDGYFQLKIFYA